MLRFTAIAPAKINFQLKVLPKSGAEEFHKVENVMQTLSLHDKLTFSIPENDADFEQIRSTRNRKINDYYGIKDAVALEAETENLHVCILIDDSTGQNMQIPADENFITKALHESVSPNRKMHVEVLVEKNIPAQAGLGGGSSDAAATLLVAQKIASKTSEDVLKIAEKLGCDVPFFLCGGCAKMTGNGSTLAESFPSLKRPIVVVKPNCGVSTKECYAQFDAMQSSSVPKGQFKLLNDLQEPACCLNSEIYDTLKFLEKNCKPENVLMTGSGSACYAICDTFDKAREIATLAMKEGLWARACSCSGIKASLID